MKCVNHKQLSVLSKEAYRKKMPLFIWGTMGIGKCLDGDTPITTEHGVLPLKNIKVKDKVFCYDFENACIKCGSVTNTFIKTDNKNSIVIETDSGQSITSSEEHHFLVKDKWVKAKDLKVGDIVFLYGKSPIALSRRDNRWGRNNNDKDRQKYEWENHPHTINSNQQLINRTDGMVKNAGYNAEIEKFDKGHKMLEGQKTSKNDIPSKHFRTSKCLQSSKNIISNIDSEKETGRDSYEIYRNETRWKEKGKTNKQKIHKRRDSIVLGIEKGELYSTRITKIHRENEKEVVLYDITTEFGNYFANGILVHNSDSIRNTAKDIAKEKGLKFNEDSSKMSDKDCFSVIDIRLSQMDLSDLRGLPKFDESTKTTRWYYPNFLPNGGQGILFLDELNLAVPTVQATAYQLILNRCIGDYHLPDGWLVISAGNRLEDRANVFETPAPLNNRFLHIELATPDVDEWIDWSVANNIDTRISTFLKFKPSLLYKFDKTTKDKAFPTPRTWAFCSEMISDKDTKDREKMEILVASCIGEATAMEFVAWLRLNDKLNIDAILKNPLEAKLPSEIDLIYAMVSGILEHYKKDKKLLKPVVQIATRLQPEFAVLMLKLIKVHNPKFVQDVVVLPEWTKNGLAKKLQPYFEEEKE